LPKDHSMPACGGHFRFKKCNEMIRSVRTVRVHHEMTRK